MLSDWMAIFLEVAGIQAPARTDRVSLLSSLTCKAKQEKSLVYVDIVKVARPLILKGFPQDTETENVGKCN